MAKYHAVYKCPLCGKLLLYGDSMEIPYDDLPKLAGMVVKNQMFMSNPALYQAPMHVPCKCADGNCGLAAFAGFRKDDVGEIRESKFRTILGRHAGGSHT